MCIESVTLNVCYRTFSVVIGNMVYIVCICNVAVDCFLMTCAQERFSYSTEHNLVSVATGKIFIIAMLNY